jgi:hypothetical protein
MDTTIEAVKFTAVMGMLGRLSRGAVWCVTLKYQIYEGTWNITIVISRTGLLKYIS